MNSYHAKWHTLLFRNVNILYYIKSTKRCEWNGFFGFKCKVLIFFVNALVRESFKRWPYKRAWAVCHELPRAAGVVAQTLAQNILSFQWVIGCEWIWRLWVVIYLVNFCVAVNSLMLCCIRKLYFLLLICSIVLFPLNVIPPLGASHHGHGKTQCLKLIYSVKCI